MTFVQGQEFDLVSRDVTQVSDFKVNFTASVHMDLVHFINTNQAMKCESYASFAA